MVSSIYPDHDSVRYDDEICFQIMPEICFCKRMKHEEVLKLCFTTEYDVDHDCRIIPPAVLFFHFNIVPQKL